MQDLLETLNDATGMQPVKQPTKSVEFDINKSYGTPSGVLDNLQKVESSGNPLAVNKETGAMGPYQFLPSTVAMLRKQGIKFDPFDPKEARAAADIYLSQLKDQNEGNLNKAVASYGGFKTKDPSKYVGAVIGFNADDVIDAVKDAQPIMPQKAVASAQPQQEPTIPNRSNITPIATNPVEAITRSPLAETLTSVATSIPASIAGGLSGIATYIATGGDLNKAGDVTRNVQSSMTYEPRTEGGKKGVELINLPFEKASEGLGMIGGGLQGISNKKGFLAGATNESNALEGQAVGKAIVPVVGTLLGAKALNKQKGLTNADLGSVGAQAGNILEMAKAKNVSKDLQFVIQNAEKKGSINRDTATNHINAESLPVPIKLTEGQATQNPQLISKELNSRAKFTELSDRFNEQNKQLVQNIDAIRERAAPDVFDSNHIESGRSLINSYKEHDAVLKADIDAKYKALSDANGGNVPLDGQTFVAQANEQLGKQMKGAYLPKEIQSVMNEISNSRQMTFENFENLRTILAADARKFERSGDGNSAAAVSIVRNALEDMPLTLEAQNLKPLADAARSSARQRFELLKKDPAYKAVVNGTVSPDDFISKFVVNGKQDALGQMKNNLAADPIATQTITNGVINYLKSKAIGTAGNFSQAGFNGPLSKLEPNLHLLVDSETAGQLKSLGETARLVQVRPAGSFVNESNTFTSALGHAAAGTAETGINMLAPGAQIGTWLRKGVGNAMDKKAVKNSLRTGAGL